MEKRIGTASVVLLAGDLTKQAVDAIVNAANPSLMGGGGVDGAIHSAGGPAILEECREIVAKIGRLDTGKAVMTTGGSLPARRVIHTVGPVWQAVFMADPALSYTVWYGCSEAKAPVYDTDHLSRVLARHYDPVDFPLGAQVENPDYRRRGNCTSLSPPP